MKNPTKDYLQTQIGKIVKVTFKDNTTKTGFLGFTEEYSEKYNYRRPGYFTIDDYDFKVSHIKDIEPVFTIHAPKLDKIKPIIDALSSDKTEESNTLER